MKRDPADPVAIVEEYLRLHMIPDPDSARQYCAPGQDRADGSLERQRGVAFGARRLGQALKGCNLWCIASSKSTGATNIPPSRGGQTIPGPARSVSPSTSASTSSTSISARAWAP